MPEGKDNYMYNRHGKDNPHSIPIVQYDLEGNKIKEWEGMKVASESLGIGKTNISACCRGKAKTAGGYIWRYKKEEVV